MWLNNSEESYIKNQKKVKFYSISRKMKLFGIIVSIVNLLSGKTLNHKINLIVWHLH